MPTNTLCFPPLESDRDLRRGHLGFEIAPAGWLASYFRGTNLEKGLPFGLDRNVPAAYRYESELGFDPASGAWMARLGRDGTSARWYGWIDLPAGRWTIRAESNDGVRLFLDGQPLIDAWSDGQHNIARTIDLVGRRYLLVAEHYENRGDQYCRIKLEREP